MVSRLGNPRGTAYRRSVTLNKILHSEIGIPASHTGRHTMETRYSPNHAGYQKLGTRELRQTFLVESLFGPGKLELVYSDADRAIIGSAVPVDAPIALMADAELRAEYFCERRELGVFNIGGPGAVEVDGRRFEMAKFDCLYV